MPEVSVIIPVYNKEKYIVDTLRSVQIQSFRDLEIIVVNDGSTDESRILAEQVASEDSRIQVVTIPNGGVSNARNIGLGISRGKWIQFLDADDMMESNYLHLAMQELRNHPAEILFSGFTMTDENLYPIKNVVLPENGEKSQEELCSCFIQYQYDTGFFGFISNKLFLRSLWERANAEFPVGTTLAEDLDFYAKLYPAVKSAYFWQGKSFLYRQSSTNYIHNVHIDYRSQLQIHLDIKNWFLQSGTYPRYRDKLDGKISEYAYFILFFDNEEKKSLRPSFQYLCQREDVMECISPEYMRKFPQLVLRCLRKRNFVGISLLFGGRNLVRSLYRMVAKA